MARTRAPIRAPGIFWPARIQTTHGVVPGNRRRAATVPTGRISGISLEALLYESRNVYFYLAETCINEYGYCCLRRR
jgi:hypothetical protein